MLDYEGREDGGERQAFIFVNLPPLARDFKINVPTAREREGVFKFELEVGNWRTN
jgi:hypothetical protein